MRVKDTNTTPMGYDPFLVDALGLSKTKKTSNMEELKQIAEKPTNWQKDILLTALDKIESNLPTNSTNSNSPLDYVQAPPLDSFQDAIKELKALVNENFKEYASKAHSNITPQDILYLFEDEATTLA